MRAIPQLVSAPLKKLIIFLVKRVKVSQAEIECYRANVGL